MSAEDQYWDQVAETWDKKITSKRNPHYHYYHTIDLLVIQLLRETEVKKALELGCGTAGCAINVLTALKRKDIYIKGIDISPRMIEIGKKKVKHVNLEDRITLEVGDVADLPYPNNEFDIVFSRGGVLSYTKFPQQVLLHAKRTLRVGGFLGLDAVPQPPKGKDYYIGKIITSSTNKKPFYSNSSNLTYEEFYTKDNVQIARKYIIQSSTKLFAELQDLFRELPSNLPGILQPPTHLKEAKLISNREVTLYNANRLRETVTAAGFQVVGIYGTGYANFLRKNEELWEFINIHRDKFSQIEILLHGKLYLDYAGMLFIIGKKNKKRPNGHNEP